MIHEIIKTLVLFLLTTLTFLFGYLDNYVNPLYTLNHANTNCMIFLTVTRD